MMEELLKRLDLWKIGDYHFERPLKGGKMSAAAIYSNTSGEKEVVKFLVLPRNEEELVRFKSEAACLSATSGFPGSEYLVKALSGTEHIHPPITAAQKALLIRPCFYCNFL